MRHLGPWIVELDALSCALYVEPGVYPLWANTQKAYVRACVRFYFWSETCANWLDWLIRPMYIDSWLGDYGGSVVCGVVDGVGAVPRRG